MCLFLEEKSNHLTFTKKHKLSHYVARMVCNLELWRKLLKLPQSAWFWHTPVHFEVLIQEWTKATILCETASDVLALYIAFKNDQMKCFFTWLLVFNSFSIAHVRCIKILTRLRGLLISFLYFVWFSLCSSLFWQFRDNGVVRNLQFDPRNHVRILILNVGYWNSNTKSSRPFR